MGQIQGTLNVLNHNSNFPKETDMYVVTNRKFPKSKEL